jgi:nucleoside-diphosphate-sugar epimerase
MRLLVIGGSGHVGTLVLPYLRERHAVTVYDLKPPAVGEVEYVAGDVNDYPTLRAATEGRDAVVYMAMGVGHSRTTEARASSFDVNVKGVFLALEAAREAGITHAVYASSMSVYQGNLEAREFSDEDLAPDARTTYGLTKRFGEEVCRAACATHGMSVNALRLCWPLAADPWQEKAAGRAFGSQPRRRRALPMFINRFSQSPETKNA